MSIEEARAAAASGELSGGAPEPSPMTASPAPVSNLDGGSSVPTEQMHSLTINGETKDYTRAEMVEFAQKGGSSDQRFREASDMKKNADNIINNLDSIVKNRDFSRFNEVFGGDGFSDAYSDYLKSNMEPASSPTGNQAPSYSEEDIRMVEALKAKGHDIDVTDLTGARTVASGLDNPQVAVMQEQIAALQEQLQNTTKASEEANINNQAAQIQRDFESVARDYPEWVDKGRVVEFIRRTGVKPEGFKKAFEDVKAEIDKEFSSNRVKWLADKSAAEKNLITGVNGNGASFNEDDYKGKSFKERVALMRKNG
jgi:hypothetical protein